MDILVNVMIALGGGIIGTLVVVVIQMDLANRGLRKGLDVSGRWVALYQATDLPNHAWMYENVDFSIRRGKLRFKTSNNQQNDPIQGDGEIVGFDHIIGRWNQIDKGATNHGVLVLTIEPGGRLMYGYYTGVSETNERRFGGWVMAREEEYLHRAKLLLGQLSTQLNLS